MRALSTHRFLFRLALAGTNVFAWVFIFQYFYLVEPDIAHGLARVALLYALSQTITCLVTPFAARLLRSGARRALLLGTVAAASSFVVLGAALEGFWGGAEVPIALAAFACGLGVYRALYWIPYEAEAEAAGKRAKNIFAELFIALAPLLGGACVAASLYGPVWLLFGGACLILISVIPIFSLRDIHEGFSWGYRETFGHMIDPANRALVTQSFLEGIAGAALLLFWPLAIFLITGWSYGMLGVVLSLTFVLAIFMRSLVRKGLRKASLHASSTLNIVFAVTPWIFRMLVATPFGVILVDSYFHTTTPRRIGLDPVVFEQAADGGSFLDEYTALKEMALSLGRIALCAVGAAAALTVSLPVAFVVVFVCAGLAAAAVALKSR